MHCNNKIVDSHTLLIMDSNGSKILPDKLSRDSQSQLILLKTLDSILDEIHKYTIKVSPAQILINVGINDLDKQTTKEIAIKYEKVLRLLKEKFVHSNILLSSIFYRKDGSLQSETNKLNKHLQSISDKTPNLTSIDHNNIKSSDNYDNKHLGKISFHTLLVNLKYVLFGILPSAGQKFRSNRSRHLGYQHKHSLGR